MLLEQGRVVVARLTEEPRRPFDIGEQECDRAGGELRHLSCFRQNGCGLSLHSTTTGPADVARLWPDDGFDAGIQASANRAAVEG
jgi:hypothetical protein